MRCRPCRRAKELLTSPRERAALRIYLLFRLRRAWRRAVAEVRLRLRDVWAWSAMLGYAASRPGPPEPLAPEVVA